ncbi:MAG: glycosyltransferase family 4 protein [Lachnospiraceae bacterium]|mgnify:CR=1 FL=1|nr:glycosyltransferase family 4 protein [Lachnospiraceae bacterium]
MEKEKGTIVLIGNHHIVIYNFRKELIQKLICEGYRVVVMLPCTEETDKIRELGCEIIDIPVDRRGMNPFKDIQLFLRYRKNLKRLRPDLVLTYTIKPNIYGGFCCRISKVPYISTVTGVGSSFQKKGIFLKIITEMYRISMKKAACVIFQNEENKRLFEKQGINGKNTLLVRGSGVNLECHTFEAYPLDEKIHLLYIGRIMREKGIEELLAAAEELHDEQIVFELLGYCDENYQDRLAEYEKKGIIKQLGFHAEVHEYMKASSAALLPSYHEGMSNVLMEASATGRPVIATNISGCKEIFEEGVTGFGCEPQNSESLIEAIRRFLALSNTERAEMGRKAREKMEREFDRRLVTDVYINEINKILQK